MGGWRSILLARGKTGLLLVALPGPIEVRLRASLPEAWPEGVVEIGYEIGPQHQGKGSATEAAGAIVAGAFEAGARAVIAHSLAETNASNVVMRKLGMRLDGEHEQEGTTIWRWRIERP